MWVQGWLQPQPPPSARRIGGGARRRGRVTAAEGRRKRPCERVLTDNEPVREKRQPVPQDVA